jgi:hypothetical protein
MHKAKLDLKNNQSKKGWRHGSSSRAPAWQALSPEFKHHYHQKTFFEKL